MIQLHMSLAVQQGMRSCPLSNVICLIICYLPSQLGNFGSGSSAAPFWQALIIMACCDKSTLVAMEAIKALAGAAYPSALPAMKLSGSLKAPFLDERKELEEGNVYSLAWQLLLMHAEDEAPGKVPEAQALPAVAKQFTVSR